MLGFQPISADAISTFPQLLNHPDIPTLPNPTPVLDFPIGGGGVWMPASRRNAKDLTAEYAKDKEDRSKRLTEAWEDKYEPKSVEDALGAELAKEPVAVVHREPDPEPVITSLEPFVFPAINISDEEIQAVMELAIQARQAAWMQRMNLIKMRLAKASEGQNAHLLSKVQQPRLH